jgi:hypothetical protein
MQIRLGNWKTNYRTKKDKTVAHCSNVRTGSSIKEEEERENKAKKGNKRTTYTWRLRRSKGEKERRGMRAHRRSKTIPSTGRRRHCCSAPAGAAVSAFIDVYTAVACQQGGRSQSEVAVDVLLSLSLSSIH